MTSTQVRPSVQLRGLRRSFGERVVLDGIDLSIAPGEFVALLGQSGTGKSTLLRALAGLDSDIEGHITVPRQRAVVFQEPRLMPWKRVWRNVVLGLSEDGKGKPDRARASLALAEVGLTTHEDAWPATLSGGEAQRVALARALARRPELLLLDEPFGALDALTRLKMQALVAQLCLRYSPAVLLVTHDVDEAIVLAQRILVLRDGRLVTDIQVEVPTPRRRADLAFGHLRSRLLADLGVLEDDA
jgi:sulfonate transport system ATP-binding protein